MIETSAMEYWESLHREYYGLTSVGYIGVGRPFNAWMYRVRRRVFRDTVPPFVAEPDPEIFDIGSRTGFYLDRWREQAFGESPPQPCRRWRSSDSGSATRRWRSRTSRATAATSGLKEAQRVNRSLAGIMSLLRNVGLRQAPQVLLALYPLELLLSLV